MLDPIVDPVQTAPGVTEMDVPLAISTHDLVKRFRTAKGPIVAVDHLTLEVKQGETFGLIGPDGAGKSTTLRVILGLLARNEGQSSVLGLDSMRDVYAIRQQAGYIAQQFVLPADLTVQENMRFFADVHEVSLKEQRQRIPALLAFAGLEEFHNRLAGQLSGGMKKKLALACNLVHEPIVVMLDEPTLGVDPVSRREFWNLLGNLRAEKGLTIFVCTPYMDEAERCNRVGLIYQGRLFACDTPKTIKTMVPGYLVEFTPAQLEEARQVVTGVDGVLEVQTYGAMIHALVNDVRAGQAAIESSLADKGIAVHGMRQVEVRMEEAFISLIRKQEAGSHG
jgi:ABC-2 type transport system ATP-binding protein